MGPVYVSSMSLRDKGTNRMKDLELFRCFNVDMSQHMTSRARMGDNIWLWSIKPVKNHTVGSAKNTGKKNREERIQQLKEFYENFGRLELSPFD